MKKFIDKIKLIWKGRKLATNLLSIKSKWREPLFWVTLLGNLTAAIASFQDKIPEQYAGAVIIANGIFSAAYSYVRGLHKAQTDGVKPYSTASEMWLGLATMANNAMINVQAGGVNIEWLAIATVLGGHSIAAARDLANMRPKEVVAAQAATPQEIENAAKE